ncbi:MAG TPA: cupin domain-containing protein [Vitreimonas sp.]|nr:cupin domain-containing protein [Vitreimonas sp.]
MYFDEARQFLMVEGVIARGIATFPLLPRPKRRARTAAGDGPAPRAAAFDSLAGNTTLGIHLSEVPPGGEKQGHRHLDEATFYIVSGRGWSELRQSDDKPDQRIDWEAGDVVTIPSNAWHKHYNADPDRAALQLAFKNTRLLRKLFHSREFVYQNEFRFHDRYDDEDDYWTRREAGNHGKLKVNLIKNVVAERVEPEPDAGTGVGVQRFSMGGHRMIDHALVEIGLNGRIRPHRHLAEEAMLILAGSGRTRLWTDDGREATVDWTAGDLLSPPFRTWREHVQTGEAPVRFLRIQNNFIERALGVKGNVSLHGELPVRWQDVVEADRSAFTGGDGNG